MSLHLTPFCMKQPCYSTCPQTWDFALTCQTALTEIERYGKWQAEFIKKHTVDKETNGN